MGICKCISLPQGVSSNICRAANPFEKLVGGEERCTAPDQRNDNGPTMLKGLLHPNDYSCIHAKAVSVERLANQKLHLNRDKVCDWLDARR
ncbi:hypothetical protein TNCV_4982561 [Trichonephila clavipes]|nr:hypothetical protein TNCV_4982561 [Trichonephila clavipes]